MSEYEKKMIEESLEDEEVFKELRESCPREFSNIVNNG